MNRQEFLKVSLLAPLLLADTADAEGVKPQAFDEFIDLLYRQKRVSAAFEKYAVEDYIQHSPGMAQGRKAAIEVLTPMFARENFSIRPARALHDGRLLVVLLDVRLGDAVRAMVVDIFRHAHGRLVEHWDLKLEIPVDQRAHYFDAL